MSADRRVGGAAQCALLIALAGLGVRLWLAPSRGYYGVDGDLIEHKQAMHLALTRGIGHIYESNVAADPALTGAEWDGAYFTNQPPFIYELRYLPVLAYRLSSPKGFNTWSETLNYLELEKGDLLPRLLASRGFTVALKLPGILADLAIGLGLFWYTRRRRPDATALGVSAAYALNPGIVLNTAFWGQPDAVLAVLVVLAFFLLHQQRVEAAWGAGALALLTKPQAIAYLPLLLVLSLGAFPPSRLRRAALAALLVSGLVFLPFLLQGTFVASTRALWTSTVGGEPFVSCDAANLWWLVASGDGYGQRDDVAWVGPMSARTLGLVGVLLANALLARGIWRRPDPDGGRALRAASLAGLSFFMLATELHENHMMAVIPLLALSLRDRPRRWPALGALSVTFLANLVLFDPALHGPLAAMLGIGLPLRTLTLVTAAINVIVWVWLFADFLTDRAPSELRTAPDR